MSKDCYHEMFAHFMWHTKESRMLIAPSTEKPLYDIIRQRALQPGGVFVYEIGGTQNHVHLVARINPTLSVPEWIGRIKGGSSHDVNQQVSFGDCIYWQDGYGIVNFGEKDLPWVREYVRNQKEHHRKGTIFDRLERFMPLAEPEDGSSQESKPGEPG